MKVRRQTECLHRESGGPDTSDIRSEVNKKIRNTGGRDRPKSADGAARPDSTAINPHPTARNREKNTGGRRCRNHVRTSPAGMYVSGSLCDVACRKNLSSYLL